MYLFLTFCERKINHTEELKRRVVSFKNAQIYVRSISVCEVYAEVIRSMYVGVLSAKRTTWLNNFQILIILCLIFGYFVRTEVQLIENFASRCALLCVAFNEK